jgi:hypothetical protein
MKRMLFAGACDKSDLLLYVSKLLTKLDLKVLLVDATNEQQYNYSIAKVDNEYKITEFEEFDVASGFSSWEELETYFQSQQEKLAFYSYLIVDTDNPDSIAKWGEIEHHMLVTNLEKRCLHQNVELIKSLFETKDKTTLVRFFKVILQAVDCGIDEEYIEAMYSEFPIQWTEPSYAVYLDDVDYATKIENQYNSHLQIKTLSKPFKEVIMDLVELISGLKEQEIKAAWKQAERRK